ncbi:hypothetical protein ABIE67_006972 [Streptomyces sp. V4I8]
MVAFETVRRAYGRIGERLGLGRIPETPHRERSLVIVPVSSPRDGAGAGAAVAAAAPEQRGAVVAHAVRRETDAVICRLRFRLL